MFEAQRQITVAFKLYRINLGFIILVANILRRFSGVILKVLKEKKIISR